LYNTLTTTLDKLFFLSIHRGVRGLIDEVKEGRSQFYSQLALSLDPLKETYLNNFTGF